MSKPLTGKVALVTGGSRGLGAATVRLLAERRRRRLHLRQLRESGAGRRRRGARQGSRPRPSPSSPTRQTRAGRPGADRRRGRALRRPGHPRQQRGDLRGRHGGRPGYRHRRTGPDARHQLPRRDRRHPGRLPSAARGRPHDHSEFRTGLPGRRPRPCRLLGDKVRDREVHHGRRTRPRAPEHHGQRRGGRTDRGRHATTRGPRPSRPWSARCPCNASAPPTKSPRRSPSWPAPPRRTSRAQCWTPTAATTPEPEPLPRAPKDIAPSGRAPPTTRVCVDTPQEARIVMI
ncbi:hypothetical protein SALBM135S_02652 [Streptomyces alboniger]